MLDDLSRILLVVGAVHVYSVMARGLVEVKSPNA